MFLVILLRSDSTMALLARSRLLFFLISGSLVAQTLLEMPVPARPTNKPQTEQEAEIGRQRGRALPVPELLEPALDTSLHIYEPREGTSISGTFRAAASDVLPGLVAKWITAFRRYYPLVSIDLEPPYAGSLGAKELVKGNIDLVFVSRELKPDDIVDFKAKFGYEPLSIPISGGSYRHFGFLDAVAFFVHPDNPLQKLGFDQLDALLSTTRHRGGGAIRTWGQLRLSGGWSNQPVHVYGIQPWNGFEEFVRQRVLSVAGRRGEWREDLNFDKVVFPVAGRVAADRLGIGYSGLAYLDAPVKLLAVGQSKDGPVYAPTYENVALGTYPLSRLIYLNCNRRPGKPINPALGEFVKFILSREGQRIILEQGIYIPLRLAQTSAAQALLEK